jgi:hypothetical protein
MYTSLTDQELMPVLTNIKKLLTMQINVLKLNLIGLRDMEEKD